MGNNFQGGGRHSSSTDHGEELGRACGYSRRRICDKIADGRFPLSTIRFLADGTREFSGWLEPNVQYKQQIPKSTSAVATLGGTILVTQPHHQPWLMPIKALGNERVFTRVIFDGNYSYE